MSKKTEASTTATAEDKPEKKRKMLTPEERIAKAEAELKRVKEQAQGKDRKRHEALVEKRSAISERVAKLNAQLEEIESELVEIEARVPELVESTEG